MLKKILYLCLIGVMMASTVGNGYPARAAENSGSDFVVSEVDDGVAIINYRGASKDVHIPAEIGGRKVVYIGDGALRDKQLKSVILPDSLKSIGDDAFSDNEFETLTLPDGLEHIGEYAFFQNQIETVTLPATLKSIGASAFYRNQIKTVTLPDKLESIGEAAFAANQLTTLTVPSNWEDIGESMFYGNQLTTLELPENLKSIGRSAFSSNRLETVTLPASLESIGEFAFSSNRLETVTLPASLESIGGSAFSNNQLTTLVLPVSLKRIGRFAFAENQLSTLALPVDLESIGEYAFFLNRLEDVVIPESVKVIENGIFLENPVRSIQIEGEPQVSQGAFFLRKLEGHTFDGWYTDSAFTSAWDGSIRAGGLELHAKWRNDIQYEIHFHTNGGNELSSMFVHHGEKLPRPGDPARLNHTFEGWYKDEGLTEAWDFDGEKVEGAVTLYARWKVATEPVQSAPPLFLPLMWKVTFESHSGSQVPEQFIPNQGKALAPQAPEREGQRFLGWFRDEELTIPWDFELDRVKESLTLYAKWEPVVTESTVQEEIFSDMENSWAKREVGVMAKKGYIAGYPDGTFRPDAPIQRQHAALLFARALQLEPRREETSFRDVPADHPYYDAIVNVQRAGMVEGYQGGFYPEALVTRAQVAKMIATAFELSTAGAGVFKDVSPEAWYYSYITALEKENIIRGYQGMFHPDSPVTRAEFAVILYRLHERYSEVFSG